VKTAFVAKEQEEMAGRRTKNGTTLGFEKTLWQAATRDLDDLVRKGVILRVGAGRGAHYVKAKEMPQK